MDPEGFFSDGKECEGKGDPGVGNSGSGRSPEPGAGTSLAHSRRAHGGHSWSVGGLSTRLEKRSLWGGVGGQLAAGVGLQWEKGKRTEDGRRWDQLRRAPLLPRSITIVFTVSTYGARWVCLPRANRSLRTLRPKPSQGACTADTIIYF